MPITLRQYLESPQALLNRRCGLVLPTMGDQQSGRALNG